MKKLYSLLDANGRVLLLRLLARLHCGLIAANVCVMAFELLRLMGLSEVSALLPVYLRGLLFGIPVALSFYAAKKLPSLWQFLLASLLISGVSWLLLGHPGGAVMAAVVCFFRIHGRLSDEGRRSAFEAPNAFVFVLFLAEFFFSAAYRLSGLQRVSIISAVLYCLVFAAFLGVERLEKYLALNREMHGVPVRRIQRITGTAVAAGILLSGILLLPPAFGASGSFRIDLPKRKGGTVLADIEASGGGGSSPMAELFGGDVNPVIQIPPFVSYLIYALTAVGLAALILYGVYKIFKNFRFAYSDSRDVIESLADEPRDEASSASKRRERISALDRSPNAVIRRQYRKQVKKAAKEQPKRWQSPAEIESDAGIEEPRLHALYEQARYGAVPCTQEDVRALKSSLK